MTTYFDLLFLAAPKEAMRQPAVSHVALKHATYGEYKGVKTELPLITPRCLSFAELERFIDHLKQELDEIKKEAKGKYEEYQHLQQSW
jgi:hypothetical protein